MSFYFLVASLPYLQFGTKPPITMNDFLSECQRQLSVEEFEMIQQALANESVATPNQTIRQWQAFLQRLNNESVWLRAGELNIDPIQFLNDGRQESEAAIVDAVASALKSPDPLTAQKMIDRLIWQKIEELEEQHFFDLDCVFVYGLKLKILGRYAEIATSKGRDKFEEIKSAVAMK